LIDPGVMPKLRRRGRAGEARLSASRAYAPRSSRWRCRGPAEMHDVRARLVWSARFVGWVEVALLNACDERPPVSGRDAADRRESAGHRAADFDDSLAPFAAGQIVDARRLRAYSAP